MLHLQVHLSNVLFVVLESLVFNLFLLGFNIISNGLVVLELLFSLKLSVHLQLLVAFLQALQLLFLSFQFGQVLIFMILSYLL